MRECGAIRVTLVLFLCGAAAGCRSLTSPPRSADGGLVGEERGFDWVSPGSRLLGGEGAGVVLLPEESQKAADAFAFYSTGMGYELHEDASGAQAWYDRAGEAAPDSEEILQRRMAVRFAQGKNKEAAELVEAFYAGHPASEAALTWLMHLYAEAKETNRVLQLVRQRVEHEPKAAENWLRLALVQEQILRDKAAVAETTRRGILVVTNPLALRMVQAKIQHDQGAETTNATKRLRREAMENLRAILAEAPDDAAMRRMLGRVQRADGRLGAAVETFTDAERRQPENLGLKVQFTRDLVGGEEKEGMRERLCALARKRGGERGFVHSYIGILLEDAEDLEGALAAYRRAVAVHPDDVVAWIRLAALTGKGGEGAAAGKAILLCAEEANPKNPRLPEALGCLAFDQKDYEGADRAFSRAVALATNGLGGMERLPYVLSLVCTHLGRTGEAAGWLKRALEQDTGYLDRYLGHFLSLDEAGAEEAKEGALEALDVLDAVGTNCPEMLALGRAVFLLNMGRDADAVEAFGAVEEHAKKDPERGGILSYDNFHFWYGVSLDKVGRKKEAMARLERCLRINPDHADALNYMAYTWACDGMRLYDALQAVRRALKKDPENAAYLDTLGWVYYQLGLLDAALEELEAADARAPGDPEITEHIRLTREKLAEREAGGAEGGEAGGEKANEAPVEGAGEPGS